MTEIEKIEYAKEFIDKLANGINPLDDTPVKEGDAVNNVRLSRCFFFVSDILRQVIENGGVTAPPKRRYGGKQPFYLTADELLNFAYSNKPVSISEIAKRLNELKTNENMRKITYKDLTAWLLSIGMLKEETDFSGKTVKLPTENGNELGIFLDTRMGARGEYTVTVYNLNAQAFIVDNMESIFAFIDE